MQDKPIETVKLDPVLHIREIWFRRRKDGSIMMYQTRNGMEDDRRKWQHVFSADEWLSIVSTMKGGD